MWIDRREASNRGMVLIVVIGVLALLSVLAATFGMLMSVNLAASRNETEYETARQAALAGEEYLINALQANLAGAGMTLRAAAGLRPESVRPVRRPVPLQARRDEDLFRRLRADGARSRRHDRDAALDERPREHGRRDVQHQRHGLRERPWGTTATRISGTPRSIAASSGC